jgi:acetyltransferase-like isoleucine patch superfamily enzyme
MNLLAVLYNKLVYRPWLRCRLHRVGKGFRIGYSSELRRPHLFNIGDNFFTGPHCYFASNAFSPVTIGADVMLGPYCKIIGGNHDSAYTKGVLASHPVPRAEYREIIIESGVWIGTNAVILSGAHIGEGAIIGAMSLVNHFVPPYTVAVGIPAKRLFSRFMHDEDLEELLRNVGSQYTVEEIRQIQKEHAVGQAPAHSLH